MVLAIPWQREQLFAGTVSERKTSIERDVQDMNSLRRWNGSPDHVSLPRCGNKSSWGLRTLGMAFPGVMCCGVTPGAQDWFYPCLSWWGDRAV